MFRALLLAVLAASLAGQQVEAKGFGSKDNKSKLIGKQTVFLQLSVRLTEVEQTIADAAALKAYAKETGMGDNVKLMLNTMEQRMKKMVKDADTAKKIMAAKKTQEEKERAAREAAGEGVPMVDSEEKADTFTVKPLAVRKLKQSGYAKKCNIKRYAAADVPGLVKSGEIDLSLPFIATGGTPALAETQQKWTAGNMKLMSNIKVRYLKPAQVAKQNKGYGMQQARRGAPARAREPARCDVV